MIIMHNIQQIMEYCHYLTIWQLIVRNITLFLFLDNVLFYDLSTKNDWMIICS